MKIQDKDRYHGAALTQIVEHPSFKALNKADHDKYGHYQINDNVRILLKYSKAVKGPWRFTFQKDDLATINADTKAEQTSFVCLVCGKKSICILAIYDVESLIDLAAKNTQWVKVEYPRNGRMRVSGSAGELFNTIPHNAFPDDLFRKMR